MGWGWVGQIHSTCPTSLSFSLYLLFYFTLSSWRCTCVFSDSRGKRRKDIPIWRWRRRRRWLHSRLIYIDFLSWNYGLLGSGKQAKMGRGVRGFQMGNWRYIAYFLLSPCMTFNGWETTSLGSMYMTHGARELLVAPTGCRHLHGHHRVRRLNEDR